MNRRSGWFCRLAPWLVLVAGAIVYINSLAVPLLFDDRFAILQNPNLRQLWPLSEAMSAPRGFPVAGRPVACLTLALNYAWGRLDVHGYHAVNLALHLASGWVLFGLVRTTLAHGRTLATFAPAACPAAFAVALVWILHPLQTEAVTYLTQRTELLVGLFYLCTVYAAARSLASPRPWLWQFAAVAACALGMGSKEVMASAPLMVVLYDRAFSFARWSEQISRWRFYAALASTWLILAALLAASPRGETVGFHLGYTPWQYAATQCWAILRYLRLAIWPNDLVFDYGDLRAVWEHDVLGRGWQSVLPAAGAIAVLLSLTVWGWWRYRPIGFLGAWFFFILAPSSSVVPIITEPAAERRMYLPLAAVVSLLVLGLVGLVLGRRASATNAPGNRRLPVIVGFACLAIVASVLGGLTIQRNQVYRTPEGIWQDTLARRPRNPRAHLELAMVMLETGRADEAISQLKAAIALRPDYDDANLGLAQIEASRGQTDAAFARLQSLLETHPRFSKALNNLGVLLLERGELTAARERFGEALRWKPDFVEARLNLGRTLAELGYLKEAEAECRRAVELAPYYPHAHVYLAIVLDAAGKRPEAIQQLRKALELDPAHEPARQALEQLLGSSGSG